MLLKTSKLLGRPTSLSSQILPVAVTNSIKIYHTTPRRELKPEIQAIIERLHNQEENYSLVHTQKQKNSIIRRKMGQWVITKKEKQQEKRERERKWSAKSEDFAPSIALFWCPKPQDIVVLTGE